MAPPNKRSSASVGHSRSRPGEVLPLPGGPRTGHKNKSRKELRKEARKAKKAARYEAHRKAHQWNAEMRQQAKYLRLRPEDVKTKQLPAEDAMPRNVAKNEKQMKKRDRSPDDLQLPAAKKTKLHEAEPATKKVKIKKRAPAAPPVVSSPPVPPEHTRPIEAETLPPARPASLGVYVPPQLRGTPQGMDKDQRLRMSLKSLFNKLSEGNLAIILNQLVEQQNTCRLSRNDFAKAVCQVMLECTIEDVRLSLMIIYPYAAVVKGLQLLLGNELAAHILRETVLRFQKHLTAGDRHQSYNALYLLCSLYTFHVIESRLIYGIIHLLAAGDEEIHVELLLLVLKACGQSLRTDDPGALQDIIATINAQQSTDDGDATKGVRRRMMLGFINDLRSKGKATKYSQGQYSAALWERLNKVISETAHKAKVHTRACIDVSWEVVAQPEVRGWWWEATELKNIAQKRKEAEVTAPKQKGGGAEFIDVGDLAKDATDANGDEEDEKDGEWEEDEEDDENNRMLGMSDDGSELEEEEDEEKENHFEVGKAKRKLDEEEGDQEEEEEEDGAEEADSIADMSDMDLSDSGSENVIVDDEEIDSDCVSDPFSDHEEDLPSHSKKGTKDDKAKKKKKKKIPASVPQDVHTLARSQHMTTPMKQAVFKAVVESVDMHECFLRLVKMDVKKNSREMCGVLVQLCLQEKGYNPYYVALLHRLCTGEHPRQVTYSTQCAIWAQFKVLAMTPLSLNRCLNLTRIILGLLLKGDISLAILKPLDLHQDINKRVMMFMRFLLVHLLHCECQSMLQLLMLVAQDDRLETVRVGLLTLLNKQFLDEDNSRAWLEQVLMTVEQDRRLEVEKLAKVAKIAAKALQKI